MSVKINHTAFSSIVDSWLPQQNSSNNKNNEISYSIQSNRPARLGIGSKFLPHSFVNNNNAKIMKKIFEKKSKTDEEEEEEEPQKKIKRKDINLNIESDAEDSRTSFIINKSKSDSSSIKKTSKKRKIKK